MVKPIVFPHFWLFRWRPKSPKFAPGRPRTVFKRHFFHVKNFDQFWSVLCSILGPFWDPFGSPNPPTGISSLRPFWKKEALGTQSWPQEAPRDRQEHPGGPQEASRGLQGTTKSTQETPQSSPGGPNRPPRGSKDAPKKAQERPKRFPRGPRVTWGDQRCSRSHILFRVALVFSILLSSLLFSPLPFSSSSSSSWSSSSFPSSTSLPLFPLISSVLFCSPPFRFNPLISSHLYSPLKRSSPILSSLFCSLSPTLLFSSLSSLTPLPPLRKSHVVIVCSSQLANQHGPAECAKRFNK